MHTKILYRLSWLAMIVLLLPSDVLAQGGTSSSSRDNTIRLLEPIGGVNSLQPSPRLGVFFTYFNLIYPWLAGVAAGIALLMVLVGGMQYIMSGGDQGKKGEGIERIKWAIAGLLMLGFATMILRLINPSFYKA